MVKKLQYLEEMSPSDGINRVLTTAFALGEPSPFEELDPELEQFSGEKLPNPESIEITTVLPPSQRIQKKWRLLWEATLDASEELEGLSWRERAKNQLWLYNLGQIRGFFQGLQEGIVALISSKSRVRTQEISLRELSKELPHLGEGVLDFGTEYMNADWETKGELAGLATVKTGLWILNIRKAFQDLGKILKKIGPK